MLPIIFNTGDTILKKDSTQNSKQATTLEDPNGSSPDQALRMEYWELSIFFFATFLMSVLFSTYLNRKMWIKNYWKEKKEHSAVSLDLKKLTEELINIKTEIKFFYIIGPLIILIMSIFGIRNWSELSILKTSAVKNS